LVAFSMKHAVGKGDAPTATIEPFVRFEASQSASTNKRGAAPLIAESKRLCEVRVSDSSDTVRMRQLATNDKNQGRIVADAERASWRWDMGSTSPRTNKLVVSNASTEHEAAVVVGLMTDLMASNGHRIAPRKGGFVLRAKIVEALNTSADDPAMELEKGGIGENEGSDIDDRPEICKPPLAIDDGISVVPLPSWSYCLLEMELDGWDEPPANACSARACVADGSSKVRPTAGRALP